MSYRICREPCAECPWKGRYDLRPGALRGIMDGCRQDDAVFICHMTQREEDGVEVPGETWEDEPTYVWPVAGPGTAAVCAGWMEAMRSQDWRPQALQVAERLDADDRFPAMIERVAPPERSLRDA